MLSVIIPFCREWPQVVFTIRSIHNALINVEHEIIAVDNLMPNMQEDRATSIISGMANAWEKKGEGWLKYLKYDEKLSHWQAKNFAMLNAKGDYFWFIDAHCIAPSGNVMEYVYDHYVSGELIINGSVHLPLTYHILEPTKLMYKAVVEPSKFDYAYSFHTLHDGDYEANDFVKVPAMSTCGMLVSRRIMNKIGHWPTELGIYSGGEHFINYVFAVMGFNKYVYTGDTLCHHGDKRGYNWNHNDQQRNRAIACFMYGGEKHLQGWLMKKAKLSGREKHNFFSDIINKCRSHREFIESQQVCTIEEWLERWKGHELLKLGE